MVKKLVHKAKEDQEKGARRAVLEDLFVDFNHSRAQVYKMNFIRGIFFGVGSVLGGTVVIALLVWILALLADNIPVLHDALNGVSQTIESGKR